MDQQNHIVRPKTVQEGLKIMVGLQDFMAIEVQKTHWLELTPYYLCEKKILKVE